MSFATFHVNLEAEPLVATAIHAGHYLRPEIARALIIDESDRLREEDPYTDAFTVVAPNRVIVNTSRFEVDVNRPRDEAVYESKEEAWGLRIYDEDLASAAKSRSLELYDGFYARLGEVLDEVVGRHGGVVVLDLHAYNHRRKGPERPPSPQAECPDINVGTGSVDRTRWGALVDRFMHDLHTAGLDARENVVFKGRALARFVHDRFPATGCCLAVEFKKTFMDEWTGDLDPVRQRELVESLASTVPGLLGELAAVTGRDPARRG